MSEIKNGKLGLCGKVTLSGIGLQRVNKFVCFC